MMDSFSNFVSPQEEIHLSAILAKLNKKESRSQMFYTGDCGTFALALARILAEQGYSPDIIAIAPDEKEDDLVHGEPDIYHILLYCNGVYFDGMKIYSGLDDFKNDLEGFIATNSEGGQWNKFVFNSSRWNVPNGGQVGTLIRSNTNYCGTEQYWENLIRRALKDRKIIIP